MMCTTHLELHPPVQRRVIGNAMTFFSFCVDSGIVVFAKTDWLSAEWAWVIHDDGSLLSCQAGKTQQDSSKQE